MKKKAADIHIPPDIESFKGILKDMGYKATPQRVAVHEAMLSLIHASADMVAEFISAKASTRVTVASVYNILSGLADLGIYARRLSPGNKMWFDVNAFRHIHAYDTINGTYIDLIDDELVKSIEDSLKKKRIKGFKIERVDIQLICRPGRKIKTK